MDPVEPEDQDDDDKSDKTNKTHASAKTVTWDVSVNEVSTQTECRIQGCMVRFREYRLYKTMLDVQTTATKLLETKRQVKEAEKAFLKAKGKVNCLRQVEQETE